MRVTWTFRGRATVCHRKLWSFTKELTNINSTLLLQRGNTSPYKASVQYRFYCSRKLNSKWFERGWNVGTRSCLCFHAIAVTHFVSNSNLVTWKIDTLRSIVDVHTTGCAQSNAEDMIILKQMYSCETLWRFVMQVFFFVSPQSYES